MKPYQCHASSSRSKSRYRSAITVALALALAVPGGTGPVSAASLATAQPSSRVSTLAAPPRSEQAPRIQLAILLDTSNSMDGLIEQTRNQLWQVVNEFSGARQHGVTPILEIALFEYGNSGNAREAGYLRQLSGFTRELDAVSEALFSLTTNGGDEYCGYAIDTAVHALQWSRAEADIRTIFIAGNESFDQGPVSFRKAAQLARQYDISINTIHAGDHQTGVSHGWQEAALIAGGDFLAIDADQQVVHIEAPQDVRIAELNAELNKTYLPYGSEGADKAERQLEQDRLSSDISSGLLAKRARSKASSFYGNADWDLVDAFKEGRVAEKALVEMEEVALPEPMQGMSAQQRVEFLQRKQAERAAIQLQIRELGESRAIYVAQRKREMAAAAPSVSDALGAAIRRQAEVKNYRFE